MNAPYFNAQGLTADNCYVAWLDVMGSRTAMVRSIATAANFIFKLHVAALAHVRYPGPFLATGPCGFVGISRVGLAKSQKA